MIRYGDNRLPRGVIITCVVAVALLGGCSRSPEDEIDAAGARPNILVYMVDTLRARELGSYGAEITRTPAIDKFASESELFEHAITPSSWTRPAIASLFTGAPPSVHGVYRSTDFLSETTSSLASLPELLRSHGYYTGALVANPNVAKVFGFERGFDVFKELYHEKLDRKKPSPSDLISTAPMVVDEIKNFIDKAPHDRPFFLFVLTIDPHGPYTPPAPYDTMYDPRVAGGQPGTMPELIRFDQRLKRGESVSPELILALYRGEVSYTDAAFGELLDWIKQRNALNDIFIALTADHGEEFAEHGGRGHGKTIYEEVIHVPLILHHPGNFRAGHRRPGNVDLLDLSTTIAVVAGIDRPDYWTGRDLRRSLVPRAIIAASYADGHDYVSITRGNYKLIETRAFGTTQLFDLNEDPDELRPLDTTTYGDTVSALTAGLLAVDQYNANLRKEIGSENPPARRNTIPDEIRERLEGLGYVE